MENTNNKTDWSKRDVGALWKRESATQKYLSGYVKVDELGIERELKVIVFSNKNKKDNAKAPDYRIYLSVPKDVQSGPKDSSQSAAVPVKNSKKNSSKRLEVDAEDSENVEEIL